MTSVVRVLQPSGILDGNSANDLARQVVACVQVDATTVLLDLSDVEFINSSGIGALVSALKTTKKLGAELYICSPSFQVRDIFRITKMNKLFKIFLTQEDFEKETGMSALV